MAYNYEHKTTVFSVNICASLLYQHMENLLSEALLGKNILHDSIFTECDSVSTRKNRSRKTGNFAVIDTALVQVTCTHIAHLITRIFPV